MQYSYTVDMGEDFDEAERRVREALKEHGFGVLTEIDVKEVLMEKLGVETDRYKILGACNPEYSHRAMEMERELGVLLPCNVIVYEEDGSVKAAAVRANALLSVVDNPELDPVADRVDEELGSALDAAAER